MVECERVPGEAAVRPKRCRDALEAAATIGPRGQMQQRPPRAVDQGRRLLDFKLPYVSFTQVELDSLLNCAHSSLREHRRRRVNPYYTPARCLSNRDRNAPVANCKLDQWPASITGKPDVERDVSSDASGPVPVSVRPGVVPARHGNTNLRATARDERETARVSGNPAWIDPSLAIPKSVKPHRIVENFDVFDFALTAGEVAAIDALDTGIRGGSDPELITPEHYPLKVEN